MVALTYNSMIFKKKHPKTLKPEDIQDLYHDVRACAETVGLVYIEEAKIGITRQKRGKGFRFLNRRGKTITQDEVKERLVKLAVPPAWKDVWLCSNDKGHILATGVDEKGRKQYVYHPHWRQVRELLNFYRLMVFGEHLPKIRSVVKEQLGRRNLDKEQIRAIMIWLLDHTHIRVGNETYFEANESIGLSTLSKTNLTITGDKFSFFFMGKSHQEHLIEREDKQMASLLKRLMKHPGDRLFVTADGVAIDSSDINTYLQELTGEQISAKDFRTWGGTLAAFTYLKKRLNTDEKLETVVLEAIDQAAATLGNTRSVARAHYVHPHILAAYTSETFTDYFKKVQIKQVRGLGSSEVELLQFLELLFQAEFDVLRLRKELAKQK